MKTWQLGVLAAALCTFIAGCRSLPGPEERTEDGLVRVASRASGGVYRRPEAPFIQYKRLILEAPTVEFLRGWRKNHPEVSDTDVKRIEKDATEMFREEFSRTLIGKGSWEFADSPDPDVIIVVPRIVNLDIPAPDAGVDLGNVEKLSPRPVKLEIIGDLRDAKTGTLIGRVAMFDGNEDYGVGQVRVANRVTNIHEMRLSFNKWSRLLREALDVAKATRPHHSVPDASGELKSGAKTPDAKDPDGN
jgi:hypothetical protein